MTLQKQWKMVKDNWLIVSVLLVLVLFLGIFSQTPRLLTQSVGNLAYETAGLARSGGYYDEQFAPKVEDRKLTINSHVSLEIKAETFDATAKKLKEAAKIVDAIVLSEDISRNQVGNRDYFRGFYTIKVEQDSYAAFLTEIKTLGKVVSLTENIQDITGTVLSLEDQLSTEKARLERFKKLLAEAESTQDKITLADKIFELERRVKQLEKALATQEKRVEYVTLYVELQEKHSAYANVALIKLSQLVRNLVASVNSLLSLIFVVLPYAIVLAAIWWFIRAVKHRR